MYFLASPLYRTDIKGVEKDAAKMRRNEIIAETLEQAGIKLILPQRDVDQAQPKRKIWEQELELIRKCDGMIVILSDTRGLYLETGFANALGKKAFGLKVEETRPVPLDGWTAQWFDFLTDDVEKLIEYIKSLRASQ
ncbi:MAG: nucleoside 2-deoxyribosyltransferase [Candidatus Niyogibacteria bacterium]|nr:MAG: nucleoside 2-deoxyribosyltransferase [Candidatus Niyogibacteria bacterium]